MPRMGGRMPLPERTHGIPRLRIIPQLPPPLPPTPDEVLAAFRAFNPAVPNPQREANAAREAARRAARRAERLRPPVGGGLLGAAMGQEPPRGGFVQGNPFA